MNITSVQINVNLMVDSLCDYNLFVHDYIMLYDKLSPYFYQNGSMRRLWCNKLINMEMQSLSLFMGCSHEIVAVSVHVESSPFCCW